MYTGGNLLVHNFANTLMRTVDAEVQVIELTCCSLSLLHMILRAVAADECTYSDTYTQRMHAGHSKQLAISQICVSVTI
jgi:hypothetical protein